MPLLPASCASIMALTLWPSGVTAPMPGMTTRLRICCWVFGVGCFGEWASFPLPDDHCGALAHVRVADLQGVGLPDRPGGARVDRDGAVRVGAVVVNGGRQDPVQQRQGAEGQLGGAAGGAEVAH